MAAAQEMKPHIAFFPSPGMGQITPLFHLAKRLVLHHNLRVTFIVVTTGAPAVQTHFLSSAAATLPPDLSIVNLPAADTSTIFTPDMSSIVRLCLSLQQSLQHLKTVLIELNPKALIIDIFSTDAVDVCRELDIPVYSFYPASTVLLAFSLYFPTLDREVEGEYVDVSGPIQVPGCSPIQPADLLDQVQNRKLDAYKWYLYHSSRLRLVSGILVNTWENLDRVTLKALRENPFFQNLPTPRIYPVGPLTKDDEFLTEKDEKIITWLDKQPRESVVFVSFGSGGLLSGEQIIELAWGLEMSQQRFILVVRKPVHAKTATVNFDHDGEIIDNPSDYLPDGFIERTRGVGLVVPTWAPQVAVLGHPSTGAFLSHCGWNSTVESLANGVPMIAWPLYAEQRMNAAMVVAEVGAAVRAVGEEIVGREEVERVVRVAIEGEQGKEMRRKAKELKESGRKALDCGGSSFDSLCSVVELWKMHGQGG